MSQPGPASQLYAKEVSLNEMNLPELIRMARLSMHVTLALVYIIFVEIRLD